MQNFKLVTVNGNNVLQYPQVICFINPKHSAFCLKSDWLKLRLQEGLVAKLFYPESEKKAQGFIEYVPGEFCWRAVSAQGYMFIHCIWVNSSKWKNQGIGSLLIQDCIKEAAKQNMNGVVTLCSSGSFMAKSDLFQKNGFQLVDSAPPGYELLVKQLKPAPQPRFNDWQTELESYHGLHIVYTKQCPWVARFVSELDGFLKQNRLKINIKELVAPAETQKAPSPYATFNLIYNGRLLADHYISMTRFINILKKEHIIKS